MQHRGGGQDRLADERVPSHHLPLGLVERAGLLEDAARDYGLADVVQVGRERDLLDLVAAEREPLGHRPRQVGHPVGVRAQVGRVLVEHGEQEVAGLALGRRAPVVLLGVHALIDDAKRRRGVARLAGQEREAVRRADVGVLLRQSTQRGRHGLLELGGRAVEKHAELVAAQPVRGTCLVECRCEPHAEPRQQRIPRGMAMRVVIGLESVEVEHGERRRRVVGALSDRPLEIAQQAAPVPEAGEVVGEREEPALLDARPHRSQPDPQPCGGGDDDARLGRRDAQRRDAEQRGDCRSDGQEDQERAPRPAAHEPRERVHPVVIGRTCSSCTHSDTTR